MSLGPEEEPKPRGQVAAGGVPSSTTGASARAPKPMGHVAAWVFGLTLGFSASVFKDIEASFVEESETRSTFRESCFVSWAAGSEAHRCLNGQLICVPKEM